MGPLGLSCVAFDEDVLGKGRARERFQGIGKKGTFMWMP